jgi:hypothetical protein
MCGGYTLRSPAADVDVPPAGQVGAELGVADERIGSSLSAASRPEGASADIAALAAHANPDRRKVLEVLVDNDGWHVAKRLAVPANIVLHFLPPCTPELQPTEPLWPLIREAVANRSIGRIDRLRAIVRTRLMYLVQHPDIVQPVVGFRWVSRLER